MTAHNAPVAAQGDGAGTSIWLIPARILLIGVLPMTVAVLLLGINSIPATLILVVPVALVGFLIPLFCAAVGRVLAGALVGYRLERFIFASFALYRRKDGWLLTSNTNLECLIGDTLSIDPTGRYPAIRSRMYIRGGTLGALFAAIGIWIIGLSAFDPDASYPPIVVCGVWGWLIAAVLVFLVVAIIDTYFISRIKKVGAQAVHHEMRLYYTRDNQQVLNDRERPLEWDRETVVRLATTGRNPLRSARAFLDAYHHFLDSGEMSIAWRYINQAFAAAQPTIAAGHSRVFLEFAYMNAIYRRRPDLARIVVSRLRREPDLEHAWLRAEAAILLAEGRHEQAMDIALEALQAAGAMSNRSQAAAETERVTWIIAEVERATP